MDGKNTLELVLAGRVAAGGVSNHDYESFAPPLKEQVVALDRTIAVPWQLVSVRPGLDPRMVSRVRDLLVGLEQTEDGRPLLRDLEQTRKFDPTPADARAFLSELEELNAPVRRDREE